uniref:Regulatory protein zeste n=1 Tax=Drosophila melanogaster TaxID=7227 RepID=O44203_DROME|nr:tracheae defective protein [Drosophila melanogaster]
MVNKQYSATDLEAFMKIAANWQNSNHNLLEGVDIKTEMTQYMNSPSMNMYKKRERTQNWNHQEKKYLLDLCRKDMRIIENKRLDAGLTAVKNKAWKIIHQKFSNQFGTDRTCNRLKEQWRRMKACTRNEILDYNNRLARFGAEVADRKKPSPFTFEVWDFMQEAKKACKSEALDGIDYSKIPLALEEGFEYREDYKFNPEDHDMDDSRTPPQELCDVDIKEEENNETFNETFNHHHLNQSDILGSGERLSVSPNHSISRNGIHEAESPATISTSNVLDSSGAYMAGGGDMSGFQANFNMNNISATLEALNALRSGQFPSAAAAAAAAIHQHQAQAQAQVAMHHQHNNNNNNNNNEDDEDSMKPQSKRQRTSSGSMLGSEDQAPVLAPSVPASSDSQALERSGSSNGLTMPGTAVSTNANSSSSNNNNFELRMFMEMQSKEHMMRMKILEVQLQAAKHSRDLVEINKTLALQKLQLELASKRLPS